MGDTPPLPTDQREDRLEFSDSFIARSPLSLCGSEMKTLLYFITKTCPKIMPFLGQLRLTKILQIVYIAVVLNQRTFSFLLLAPSGFRPVMMPNILQCTDQCPTKELSALICQQCQGIPVLEETLHWKKAGKYLFFLVSL